MNEQIISFVKSLIENVRDDAIRSCNNQINATNLDSPTAKRYNDVIQSGEIKKLLEMIVSDSVDDTLFYLFNAIDNGIIDLSINLQDGSQISLKEEGLGELGGWYMSKWRSAFSKEKIFEDF